MHDSQTRDGIFWNYSVRNFPIFSAIGGMCTISWEEEIRHLT